MIGISHKLEAGQYTFPEAGRAEADHGKSYYQAPYKGPGSAPRASENRVDHLLLPIHPPISVSGISENLALSSIFIIACCLTASSLQALSEEEPKKCHREKRWGCHSSQPISNGHARLRTRLENGRIGCLMFDVRCSMFDV